jgi:hypothetical protein
MTSPIFESIIAIFFVVMVALPIGWGIQRSTRKLEEQKAAGTPQPVRPIWAQWRFWFWLGIIVFFVYGVLSPLLK